MEKARSIHEIELAVNAAEEELRDSKEVLKDVHLQAYYEDDLSLFSEADIKKAMLKEGESLWVVLPRPSQDGETSLRARFVAKGFKQQILDPSLELTLPHPHI